MKIKKLSDFILRTSHNLYCMWNRALQRRAWKTNDSENNCMRASDLFISTHKKYLTVSAWSWIFNLYMSLNCFFDLRSLALFYLVFFHFVRYISFCRSTKKKKNRKKKSVWRENWLLSIAQWTSITKTKTKNHVCKRVCECIYRKCVIYSVKIFLSHTHTHTFDIW